jgi:hypothetical protein
MTSWLDDGQERSPIDRVSGVMQALEQSMTQSKINNPIRLPNACH